MSVPRHLSNKLRETLGREAGEDLVTWLAEERSRRDALSADVAELRQEMRAGFATLGTELRAELAAQFHAVDTRVMEVRADLMKWSLVFWVGAVGAIAALAGVLR